MNEAIKTAEKIAKNSKLIVMMAKEAVDKCKFLHNEEKRLRVYQLWFINLGLSNVF